MAARRGCASRSRRRRPTCSSRSGKRVSSSNHQGNAPPPPTGFFRWLIAYRPLNLLTGPIIYSMIVPLAILDLCVIYQAICFPIYRRKVRRGDYIVFDRQQLEYLNFIEKFHCTYCAYGAGLIAYVGEIVARTEQYFCPIKHARKILGTHRHYASFLDYGDADDFETKLEKFRVALARHD
jgi:hypothetical protein